MSQIYKPSIPAGATDIVTVTGNDSIPVGPDSSGNLNLLGAGNIITSGDAATHTETISLTGITVNAVQIGGASNTLTQLGPTDYAVLNTSSSGVPSLATSPVIGGSNIGASNVLTMQNLDNTNSASNAIIATTVAGASGGDPFLQCNIAGGASYALGIDNSSTNKDFNLVVNLSGNATPTPASGTAVYQIDPVVQSFRIRYPFASISAASSGQAVNLNIQNSSNTSGSDASLLLQTVGASSGNPWLGWVTTNQGFSAGIVNSTSLFAIQNQDAFGAGSSVITATNSGLINFPLTSAFNAVATVDQDNVTGDGTSYTVVFNDVVKDQNSNYNSSTGVFTAPRAGLYHFACNLFCSAFIAGNTVGEIDLVATSGTVRKFFNPVAVASSSGFIGIDISSYVTMAAGDTVSIVIIISGGTKTVNINGAGVGISTNFSGKLVA